MDDLFALIAAIFDALSARNRPGQRPGRLGASLREALGERVAAPTTPAPRPPTPAARPAAPASAGAVALPPASAPGGVMAAPGGPAQRRAAPPGQVPEAGRITALFANPQSLVAAFIVAEVLAKPVALRDYQGGLAPFVR